MTLRRVEDRCTTCDSASSPGFPPEPFFSRNFEGQPQGCAQVPLAASCTPTFGSIYSARSPTPARAAEQVSEPVSGGENPLLAAVPGWERGGDSGEIPSEDSHVLEERMVFRGEAQRGPGPTLILAGKFLGEDDLQNSHPTSPLCPKITEPWPGGVPALKVFSDSKCPGDVFFPS